MKSKPYNWNEEKNQQLKRVRNISFEEVVSHIAGGQVLDVINHPNHQKYKGQRMFIVKMRDSAWLVPFVESDEEIFLKTIIPNRKATRKYLGS